MSCFRHLRPIGPPLSRWHGQISTRSACRRGGLPPHSFSILRSPSGSMYATILPLGYSGRSRLCHTGFPADPNPDSFLYFWNHAVYLTGVTSPPRLQDQWDVRCPVRLHEVPLLTPDPRATADGLWRRPFCAHRPDSVVLAVSRLGTRLAKPPVLLRAVCCPVYLLRRDPWDRFIFLGRSSWLAVRHRPPRGRARPSFSSSSFLS